MRSPAACCCLVCSAWLLGRCCSHSHSCHLQEARIASANRAAHMPDKGGPKPRRRPLCVPKVHGTHVQGQPAVTDLVWLSLLLRPASPAALSHRISTLAARELQPTDGSSLDRGAKPESCHCSSSDLHRRHQHQNLQGCSPAGVCKNVQSRPQVSLPYRLQIQ